MQPDEARDRTDDEIDAMIDPKEEYVERNGEEKYRRVRAQLLDDLMDVGGEDDVSPSVATEQATDDGTMSEVGNRDRM